jgi:hypothetical protein
VDENNRPTLQEILTKSIRTYKSVGSQLRNSLSQIETLIRYESQPNLQTLWQHQAKEAAEVLLDVQHREQKLRELLARVEAGEFESTC